MSDCWASISYAVVYEPTREATGIASTQPAFNGTPGARKPLGPCGTFRRIQLSVSGHDPYSRLRVAKVDAPEWLKEVYEAWHLGRIYARAISAYDRTEDVRRQNRRYADKGKWVRVVRGRKVKQGTEGLVFWTGASQWGTKVGIALPQEDGTFRKEKKTGRYGGTFESYKDVAWTYLKNVAVIDKPGGRIL